MAGHSLFLTPNHPFNKFNPMFNRFEHSVGVYLLLRKFNTSLEERIAGLLHDVSHTAFSHIADFVYGRETKHDFHEKFYKKILIESEIPEILERHGIDVRSVMEVENFGILEREIPDICADRIDYFFRSMINAIITKDWIKRVLMFLRAFNNRLVFTNVNAAREFAEKFMEANERFYCNALQATVYHKIAELIKLAMQKSMITESDLFTTDYEVYRKLKSCKDHEILKMLREIPRIRVVENKSDYDLHVKSKVRYVDPFILQGEELVRLSEISIDYKLKLEDFKRKYSEGFYVKIITL
ncbi:MAG TPA: HD domain-containing protein [Candidatus Aenigmarchaeota archaeon]|nr:HD domain-containing protein [Candidatus Aenigmarchaeota archaeon]